MTTIAILSCVYFPEDVRHFTNFSFFSGSSLVVDQASRTTSGNTAEVEEEPAGVITLQVPGIPLLKTSSESSSDYMVTTYNSVTGYETSV